MALVFNPDKSGTAASPIAVAGGVWLLFGTLTISGSYTTGGDVLNLKPFLPQLSTVRQVVALNDIQGIDLDYDVVNTKLKFFTAPITNAPTEHTAAAYNAALTGAAQPVAFLCK